MNFNKAVPSIMFVIIMYTIAGGYYFSSIFKRPQYYGYNDTMATSRLNLSSSVSQAQDFQKIGHGSEKSYAYSAYFHKQGLTGKEGQSVIVIAGIKTNSNSKLYCQLYDEEQKLTYNIKAVLKPLSSDNNSWYLPYEPYYIICSYDFPPESIPTFVSVAELEEEQESTTNFLRIKYNNEQKYNFALCHQAFYNYERPFKFVEWMEYYILMGVEKFTFYNMSIGPKTSCLMQNYGDLVEILPYSSPYKYHHDIVINGQGISNHDCLQRYRGVSKYLVIVDVDEMIIPSSSSSGNNFNEMVEHLNKYLIERNNSVNEISAYKFLHGLFFTQWNVEESITDALKVPGYSDVEKVLRHMRMSIKLHRNNFSPPNSRTKFILVPDLTVEVGIHYLEESIGNAHDVFAPEELAYLHHYRECYNKSISCIRSFSEGKKIMDTTALRFTDQVAARVSERLFSTAKSCNVDVGY